MNEAAADGCVLGVNHIGRREAGGRGREPFVIPIFYTTLILP